MNCNALMFIAWNKFSTFLFSNKDKETIHQLQFLGYQSPEQHKIVIIWRKPLLTSPYLQFELKRQHLVLFE